MSKETFYNYHCNSCDGTYTSNELESKCFYCNANALEIEVKRPLVVRIKNKSVEQELNEALDAMADPNYDWERAINK
tara:strand:+ start:1797 stop:2027 length:231 start_codon:yes stop_codon:yes gene_type:complete